MFRGLKRAVAMAATVGLIAACSPGGGGSSSGGGGGSADTLIIAMTASDIPNADTGLAQGQGYEGIRFVANQLYDGLTKFDLKQGTEIPKVLPGLAEKWSVDTAGTTWTFDLRPDVKFHDGTPWDADAAVFNFNRYLKKDSAEYYAALNAQAGLALAGIKAVSKSGDMQIKIETDGKLAYLPSNLTTIFFGSPTAIKAEGNEGFAQKPVGTGPFKFESLTRGQQLVLDKNPDYWDGAPKVSKVVLRPIPDATARVAALRAGQVNWIEVPTPDDVPQLTSSGFQVLTNTYDHTWPWVLDVRQKPLSDVRVRQALNYAVDRDSLIKNVLQGTAEPELQAAARGNAGYDKANDIYSYDPAKAKQLLAEAGYPNGFELRLSYPTSGSGNMLPTPMNEALQANLAEIGVKVKLEPVEWASMLTDFFARKIPGGAQMVNISLSMQQEGFWYSWFGSDSLSNAGYYQSKEVDALLAKARSTFDDAARAKVYSEASKVITQDAAWLFIVSDKNPRVLAANVQGFVQPQSWFADLTTITVS
jgi:peptide/nickel transport system substrate-binding protein